MNVTDEFESEYGRIRSRYVLLLIYQQCYRKDYIVESNSFCVIYKPWLWTVIKILTSSELSSAELLCYLQSVSQSVNRLGFEPSCWLL